MLIKGLQKHTLLDYPGKIACTIFLFGCDFHCGYCHNPELVDAKQASELKIYSKEEILRFLKERKGFLEAVCITGGEPTLNKDLPKFLRQIKNLGYRIKLDTNGTNPEMLELLLKEKLVDYATMDFKAPLKNYERVVNADVNLENLRKSINIIKKFPDYEFRITVVPKLTSKQDLLGIAKYLKKQKSNKKFFLQDFRQGKCLDKNFENEKPYSEKEMHRFQKMLMPYFKHVGIRGETY